MKKLLMLMMVLAAVPAYAGDNRAPWIWYGLNGVPSPQRHRDNYHDRQRYDDPYRRQHEQWNSGSGDFRYSGNNLDPWHKQRPTTTMTCGRLDDGSTVCVSRQ
jgi:hypothetical protein